MSKLTVFRLLSISPSVLLMALGTGCSHSEPEAVPSTSPRAEACSGACSEPDTNSGDGDSGELGSQGVTDGANETADTAANASPSSEAEAVDGVPLSQGSEPIGSVPEEEMAPMLELPADFDSTAAQAVAELRLGWNLGNSLDVPDGETNWGNPAVTAELLQAVASNGFDLVRIPVTWSLFLGPGPEFAVDASRMSRVAEVVGYALQAGLTTIINLHHDGADGFDGVEWLTLNDAEGAVSDENNTRVQAQFVAVWQQIAEQFANYGSKLWFESMNEIHDGYGQPDPRYFDIVNQLNQAFVNTVRASGGNNDRRYLVVPGYNTNIDHTVTGFEAPTDTLADHLILSAHYYDPFTFALEGSTNTWGAVVGAEGTDDWGQEDFATGQFDKLLQSFVEQGLPTILGEYGAVHQEGFEPYRRYYMEYVTKVASDRGILPVYWDNGGLGSGAENLGLFNRTTGEVVHADVVEAMLRATGMDYALTDIAPPAAVQ